MINLDTKRDAYSEVISAKKTSVRFAEYVSLIVNPLSLALPTLLAIALHAAPNLQQALLWWGVTMLSIAVAPIIFVLDGVHRGRYADQFLSIREQRFVPIFFALGCTSLALVFLSLFHASLSLFVAVVALLISGVLGLIITRFWKISFHLIGVAGLVTVLIWIFGPLWSVSLLLIPLVGWARWQAGVHTPLQLLAGTALGVGSIVVIFWLLGIH